MCDKPRKDQIYHKKFVWSQWDASLQRMYVAHFRKQGKNANGQTLYRPFLTTYQFNANTQSEFMVSISCDF